MFMSRMSKLCLITVIEAVRKKNWAPADGQGFLRLRMPASLGSGKYFIMMK